MASSKKVIQQLANHVNLRASLWQDKDDHYWFERLVEEVGELGASLTGDHPHTPDSELAQIVSISINWLLKRDREYGK